MYCYYYEIDYVHRKTANGCQYHRISPDDFDFIKYGDVRRVDKGLKQKDGMLLDFMYHKAYGIEIGDKLSVEMNGILQDIEVKAFYNSYQYGGRTLVIHSR